MTTILAPGEGRMFSVGGDRVTVRGVADVHGVGFTLIDYRAAPGIAGRRCMCTFLDGPTRAGPAALSMRP